MLKTYLQLVRPANVVTSVADVLAGIALSGVLSIWNSDMFGLNVFWLCLSTIGLYAGGIVFNDIFDAKLDAVERPERAIPSGKISINAAFVFGIILFLTGVIAAFQVSVLSGALALAIVLFCLLYDKWGKHHFFFGPINMGLCRGLNLVLGMSILAEAVDVWYGLAVFPVIYIAAITMISRGEVHGGSKNVLYFAALLYLLVSGGQLYVAYTSGNVHLTALFVALHLFLIFKPLLKAIQNPIGPNIGKGVKAGVLSLIVMDSAWVSVSGNIYLAVLVLLLLPVSMFLARYFAVT
jgi:hypothetical protein